MSTKTASKFKVPRPSKHGRRYDWKRIFSRKQTTLFRGTDYNGYEHSFVVYVRRAAKKFGYRIETEVGGAQVTITVTGRRPPRTDEW